MAEVCSGPVSMGQWAVQCSASSLLILHSKPTLLHSCSAGHCPVKQTKSVVTPSSGLFHSLNHPAPKEGGCMIISGLFLLTEMADFQNSQGCWKDSRGTKAFYLHVTSSSSSQTSHMIL